MEGNRARQDDIGVKDPFCIFRHRMYEEEKAKAADNAFNLYKSTVNPHTVSHIVPLFGVSIF